MSAAVQETDRGLRLVVPFKVRARILAAAALEVSIGLVGLGLVCRGVFLNWGPGWAYIAAGAPLFSAFVVHEWRSEVSRRRPS
jgi:hypothetical protein